MDCTGSRENHETTNRGPSPSVRWSGVGTLSGDGWRRTLLEVEQGKADIVCQLDTQMSEWQFSPAQCHPGLSIRLEPQTLTQGAHGILGGGIDRHRRADLDAGGRDCVDDAFHAVSLPVGDVSSPGRSPVALAHSGRSGDGSALT